MRLFARLIAVVLTLGLAATGASAEGEPPGFGGVREAPPPEGLPTPDNLVREAMRHPPGDPVQRAEVLSALYQRLAGEKVRDEARAIAQAIERVWRTSGSPTNDLLLERATAAIEEKRTDIAHALLDALIELQPDFAEAWNRRAYVYYLEQEPQRALADLRQVLALDPKHFRALEGVAEILRTLGEKKASLEAYRKLVEIYPELDGAAKAVETLSIEVEGQGI
jgi:tetratricopeptide (TPR) repeat protein